MKRTAVATFRSISPGTATACAEATRRILSGLELIGVRICPSMKHHERDNVCHGYSYPNSRHSVPTNSFIAYPPSSWPRSAAGPTLGRYSRGPVSVNAPLLPALAQFDTICVDGAFVCRAGADGRRDPRPRARSHAARRARAAAKVLLAPAARYLPHASRRGCSDSRLPLGRGDWT
jgi:hypothetical protein